MRLEMHLRSKQIKGEKGEEQQRNKNNSTHKAAEAAKKKKKMQTYTLLDNNSHEAVS